MKKIIITIITIIILFFIYLSSNIFYIIYLNSVEQTELEVKGNTLIMNNLINSKTLDQFEKVFKENPEIDTLIMQDVPGSIDDEANLKLSKWLFSKKLTFILENDSEIASWWTDLFLAWNKRIIHSGAKVWVHSWWMGKMSATDFPNDSELHIPYINYYKSVWFTDDLARKFYFFTINSASADSIYWMTANELKEYNIITK